MASKKTKKVNPKKTWTKASGDNPENPHVLIRGVNGKLYLIGKKQMEQYRLDDDTQDFVENQHPIHTMHSAVFPTADGDDDLGTPQAYVVQDSFPPEAEIGPGEQLAYLNLDFRPAWADDEEDD